jgi:hypothetical protein
MLADYCIAREQIGKVMRSINKFDADWIKSAAGRKMFKDSTALFDTWTKAAARLATKLRLTNQSRYTPQAAATLARNAPRGTMPLGRPVVRKFL